MNSRARHEGRVAETKWVRVHRGFRCPICAHDKWCTIAPDGSFARCKRVESDSPVSGQDGDAWLHRLTGAAAPPPPPAEKPRPDVDWGARAERCSEALTEELVRELAQRLGVDARALLDLGLGWDGQRWTFPMFAADGTPCGIRTRRRDWTEPRSATGSKLGVYRTTRPDDGLLVVCEGESDTAAALTLGFSAIGTPGAGQCAAVLAAYARGRNVAIVADADEPGRVGADALRTALQGQARAVHVIEPPAPHKDLRAWLRAGASRADVERLLPRPRRGLSLADVVGRWSDEGPIVHAPTGIAALDAATGGGLVLGSRVYLAGAPDAGKTALLVHVLDTYAQRGLAVGLLAVDEEPEDVLQRFLQRRGWARRDCEARHPEDLARMAIDVAELPVVLYGAEWTIEAAAEDLARLAAERGTRAVLGIDSIQTARCEADDLSGSRYEAVSGRVAAVRVLATRYRMLTIATSEMTRAAYRSTESRDALNDLAAAKESGAIEYSARVLLTLRNLPGEPDLVSLRIPKNKHGPTTPADDRSGIVLRLLRATQELVEVADYVAPDDDEREAVRAAASERRATEDAAAVAVLLTRHPGLTSRRLRALARLSVPRLDVALERLAAAGALVRLGGGPGTPVHHHLQGSRLPADVLADVPLMDRPAVVGCTPPEGGVSGVSDTVADTVGMPPSGGVCQRPPVGGRDTPPVAGAPEGGSESASADTVADTVPQTGVDPR